MENKPVEMLDPLALTLMGACLLCWVVAYVVIIRRGLADRVCGMPMVPLAINMSWEFIFGVMLPDKPPANIANIVWLIFDFGIVYVWWRHGRREWPALLPRWTFVPGSLLVLALAFAGVLAITYQFKDWTGSYTGWGDNLLIQAAFIAMLLRRGSTAGQSMWISLSTLVGSTVLIPLEMRITGTTPLMLFLYAGFIVLGLIYAVLLHRQFKAEGKNPWSVW